jgi:hypothetical protein
MGSVVRSIGYKVLHRPVEPAAFIRSWHPKTHDFAGAGIGGKFFVSMEGGPYDVQIANSGTDHLFKAQLCAK